jgi:hypothetical protein
MNQIQDLQKRIKLTGERAKLDAKANGTYIVYKTAEGRIVREYSDGRMIPVARQGESLHWLDCLIVIDNSRCEGEMALVIRNGQIIHRAESLPLWVETIEQPYLT